jgi:prepilin-type processing-associated H-X9-DG protein
VGLPLFSWVVEALPNLDQQDIYNQWAKTGVDAMGNNIPVSYFDAGSLQGGVYVIQSGNASNNKLANTPLAVLKCPDDNSTQPGQGNLSYVVNGGFNLWHASTAAWVGSPTDGVGGPTSTMTWIPKSFYTTAGDMGLIGTTQKLGVMFLESEEVVPITGKVISAPWNIRSTLGGIADGATNTLLLAENTLAGAGPVGVYSPGVPFTSWASPMPQLATFMGSNQVCLAAPNNGDCTAGGLTPNGDIDGQLWGHANRLGNYDNIGFGQSLTQKGGFPFANSAHPSGGNYAFCDGRVQFITNTINGEVYSKIITPSGSRLPLVVKQLPVEQDAFTQ